MKYLIDTHVLLWLITDSNELGASAKTLLADSNNSLYVSYFSLQEMALKSAIGKLTYSNTIEQDLAAMGIELIMPTVKIVQEYTIFNDPNKDPFDNLLLATSLANKCIFVTADRHILNTKVEGLKLVNATLQVIQARY